MLTICKVIVFLVVVALTSSEVEPVLFLSFAAPLIDFFFKMTFSIYKLECIDEKDSNYTKNISCFLKTISRGVNALTTFSDLVTPIDYINGNIQVLQKSSSNSYRNIIINNSLEICSMLGDNAPPLLKFCLPLITKFAPDLIRPCPYQGKKVGVENLPIDISLLPLVYVSNIPKGEYRVVS